MHPISRVELHVALLLTLLACTSIFAQATAPLKEICVVGQCGGKGLGAIPGGSLDAIKEAVAAPGKCASLTVPTIEQARAEIQLTPGALETSYAHLNFRVGYDAGAGWSGRLKMRNLFDKHHISSVAIAGVANASLETFNPGTGRAIHGGLHYRW